MNAYVAKDKEGVIAMCFDHPNLPDETQRFIRAETRRKGIKVERTTAEEALRLLAERMQRSKS